MVGLNEGDAVFFVAGEPQKFFKFAGAARTRIGEELGLIDRDRFAFCWIVDFPMYEWNEEEKKIDFSHNPFSMPNLPAEEFLALEAADREKVLGTQGHPIRHCLQWRGAFLRRDPQPSAGRDEEGFRHRRL